jgi:Asp-tRNA(Asn)/Glu-tRNA(Gln) amidotransferase A subunit family amidase
LQFMARAFDEASLFRVAGYYQELTDWHLRQP